MKHDLKDITFTIPVRIDSQDRINNINYILDYIFTNFDTNVIVFENGPKQVLQLEKENLTYQYTQGNGPFHRTKYLNDMAKLAKTDYIANYDCDVIFPVKQILKAHSLLKDNKVDFVYPYDGLFVNITKHVLDNEITNFNFDPVNLDPEKYQNFGRNSMGGALLWNKKAFIDGGMENEKFVSWGCEDWERFHRFTKLGYRVGRIKGPLYHISHSRTQDSNESNPFYQHNVVEFQKIDKMDATDLKEYMKTWPWLY
jgi:predicted glycosyltransferase involved in capsule biosynthesis